MVFFSTSHCMTRSRMFLSRREDTHWLIARALEYQRNVNGKHKENNPRQKQR